MVYFISLFFRPTKYWAIVFFFLTQHIEKEFSYVFFSFIVIFLLLWLYFHINFLSILNLSWSMIMVYESNIFSIWPSHHLLKYLSFLHCIRVGLKYYNKEVLKYYWNQIEIISLTYCFRICVPRLVGDSVAPSHSGLRLLPFYFSTFRSVVLKM